MLNYNMKRVNDDVFHHYSNAFSEEANKAKLQHQLLLKEFLALQKEFVSRKRKLQSANQKRAILFAEVRFLRRRQKYLLERHSLNIEPERYLVRCQNSDAERYMVQGERSNDAGETAFEDLCPASISNSKMRDDERQRGRGREGGGGGELVTREELRMPKMPENYLIEDERFGTKKIPCHNQVTLKV